MSVHELFPSLSTAISILMTSMPLGDAAVFVSQERRGCVEASVASLWARDYTVLRLHAVIRDWRQACWPWLCSPSSSWVSAATVIAFLTTMEGVCRFHLPSKLLVCSVVPSSLAAKKPHTSPLFPLLRSSCNAAPIRSSCT